MAITLTNWTIALSLFGFLQLGDVITTILGLRFGAREANPVIAWCMRKLGSIGWIAVKLVLVTISALLLYQDEAILMMWFLCLVYSYVVVNNLRIIRKSKKNLDRQ